MAETMAKAWEGFVGGAWEKTIDVRDFIQKNYTPYEGDESFLAGPTESTTKLWSEVMDLFQKERENGGVLDMDTKLVSTVDSHEAGYIDKDLETAMDEVLKIVVMGRACRNSANIKNRQPIGQMYVKAPEALGDFYKDIIADELNVKNVTFTDDVSSYTDYQFKPQLRTVGPKYGKYLKQIQAALSELDGNAAMKELKENGCLKLDSVSSEVVLLEEDLLITMTQAEGFVTEGDNNVTVVMDTRLTPELIEEGFVRELISKIQTMRKEAGFEVMDHIAVSYTADEKVTGIFNKYGEKIQTEVLANAITAGTLAGYQKEWSINGEKVTLAVEKQ